MERNRERDRRVATEFELAPILWVGGGWALAGISGVLLGILLSVVALASLIARRAA